MARAHGTAGRHATRNDAHPLARVVQVFQQRFAQRPIGWKAGAGAAELVPHLIQRLGIIARLLDALECGEVLLAVRTRKGPAHIASLATSMPCLARYAVRTVVSIVTKRVKETILLPRGAARRALEQRPSSKPFFIPNTVHARPPPLLCQTGPQPHRLHQSG